MLIEGTKWEARRHCDQAARLSLEGEFVCEERPVEAMKWVGSEIGLVLLNEMTVIVLEAVVVDRFEVDHFGWKSSGKFFPSVFGKEEGSKCFVFVREETKNTEVTKKMFSEGIGIIVEALRRI